MARKPDYKKPATDRPDEGGITERLHALLERLLDRLLHMLERAQNPQTEEAPGKPDTLEWIKKNTGLDVKEEKEIFSGICRNLGVDPAKKNKHAALEGAPFTPLISGFATLLQPIDEAAQGHASSEIFRLFHDASDLDRTEGFAGAYHAFLEKADRGSNRGWEKSRKNALASLVTFKAEVDAMAGHIRTAKEEGIDLPNKLETIAASWQRNLAAMLEAIKTNGPKDIAEGISPPEKTAIGGLITAAPPLRELKTRQDERVASTPHQDRLGERKDTGVLSNDRIKSLLDFKRTDLERMLTDCNVVKNIEEKPAAVRGKAAEIFNTLKAIRTDLNKGMEQDEVLEKLAANMKTELLFMRKEVYEDTRKKFSDDEKAGDIAGLVTLEKLSENLDELSDLVQKSRKGVRHL